MDRHYDLDTETAELSDGKTVEHLYDFCSNTIGIHPVEYKVLVKVDEIKPGDERYKGVIIIPDSAQFIPQFTGVLVAVGGNAFEDWKEPIPEIGNRVMFNKHAGAQVKNACKREEDWRLLNDKDINAIMSEEGL